MNNALATTAPEMLTLLHSNGLSIPKPFSKPVYLLWVPIMGMQFVNGIAKLLENINEGDRLTLVREPDNKYDEFAILVKNSAGEKIGYIPRRNNLIPARLMDAGKLLYATVRGKDVSYAYPDVTVDVYMED